VKSFKEVVEGQHDELPEQAFYMVGDIGEVIYRVGRDEHHIAAAGGFAEVRNDKVIILADVAETPADIDRARAERARDRAEARLAGRSASQEEIDYARAMGALARALTRILVASRGQ